MGEWVSGWKRRAVLTGATDGYFGGSFLLGRGIVLLVAVVAVVVHELPESRIPRALPRSVVHLPHSARLELEREERSLLAPYEHTAIAGAIRGEGERGHVDELGHGEGKALERGGRGWHDVDVPGLGLDDVELAIVVCGVDVVVVGCADEGAEGRWDRGGEGGGGHGP